MFDVTTVGSATQDIYVFSKQFEVSEDPRRLTGMREYFPFGTKIELDEIFFEVGGGATNAAYTFRNQGLRVACIARIGDDGAGRDVRTCLRKHHITDRLIIDRKHRTGHGIVFLGRTGERTILVYRGATQAYTEREIRASLFPNSRWLYLTSLGGNTAALSKVYRLAAQKHMQVCINPGKKEIINHPRHLRSLLKQSSIILLNREEAASLTGRVYGNIHGMLQSLSAMTSGIILVTEGKRGAYCLVDKQAWRVIIKPITGIDTTGAGDAFGSGFLSGFIRYRGDLQRSLTLATNNAAAVITQMGAKHGLLKKSQTRRSTTCIIKPLPIII